MTKPTALTDAEIKDIEVRCRKGWVVRNWEWEPLIAMAYEYNRMLTAAPGERQPHAGQTVTVTASYPWSPTP